MPLDSQTLRSPVCNCKHLRTSLGFETDCDLPFAAQCGKNHVFLLTLQRLTAKRLSLAVKKIMSGVLHYNTTITNSNMFFCLTTRRTKPFNVSDYIHTTNHFAKNDVLIIQPRSRNGGNSKL